MNSTSIQTFNPIRALLAAIGLGLLAATLEVFTAPTAPATHTGYLLCLNNSKQLAH